MYKDEKMIMIVVVSKVRLPEKKPTVLIIAMKIALSNSTNPPTESCPQKIGHNFI